jgi:hypothetical protein
MGILGRGIDALFDGCTEEIVPGFLAHVILFQTGEDYRNRDVLDQTARLIEIFGVDGAAQIVGCP